MLISACTSASPADTTSAPISISTTTTSPVAPTTSLATTTTTTEALDPQTQALRDEIDELVTITEQVRGLEFLQDPLIRVVSIDELSEIVREDLEEELSPEEILPTERLLETLGILEPDVDLLDLYLSLYSEQVAGFYDLETKELVVPAGDALSALQKITVVHELTHALTDQHFDVASTIFALDDAEKFEEGSALRALVEGDATWTQLVYLQTVMTAEEQSAAFLESAELDSGVLDQTPPFLQDLLLFPYDTSSGGAAFAGSLWLEDRSFDSINDAYLAVPTTTEQIVDPDRYRQSELIADVPSFALSVADYELVEEGVWGQVAFEALFDQVLTQAEAELASRGWGGDWYQLWDDGTDVVFVVRFRGDTSTDLTEMLDTWETFIDIMPTSSSASASLSGEDVWFVATSDLDAQTLVAELVSEG